MSDISSENGLRDSETDRPQSADRRHSVNLKNLFLDPNNYRFIDADDFHKVTKEVDFTRDDVQRRTTNLILGRNAENVKDLIDSFRRSGFLPVDQIQVRQLGGGRYLVVEGNRRIAALKYLQTRYDADGIDLGRLDSTIFSRVPVVYYQDADDAHHLVLMGLKHISGNKKWPAINQAELVRDLAEKHGMSAEEICESISISRKEYNLTLSTLRLIDRYRESDYGDQFSSDMYSIFREVTRNAALKSWLAWSDREGVSARPENLDRLFSWISTDEQEEDDHEDEGGALGGFRLEPVITKATHIRELSKLVRDENALNNLDTTRSLTQASLSSEMLGKNRVANSISIISQELNTVFSMVRHLESSDRLDLNSFQKKIVAILNAQDGVQPANVGTKYLFHGAQSKHFSWLRVANYRKLSNVSIDNLQRINIFAGINNSGKTSFLEVVELAANVNRFKTLADSVCRRLKLRYEEVSAASLIAEIPEWELSAGVGGGEIRVASSHETDEAQERAFYVGSVETRATFDGSDIGSVTHVFDRYPYKTLGNTRALMPAQFSSPYVSRNQEDLIEAYESAVKLGLKDQVIGFIREHIDSRFLDVEQIKGRFLVKLDGINPFYMDLANFGDGVQRIFSNCVLFAAAKGGVVLIDECESGIHNSLFGQFASFISRLSDAFNVQVFLSTHSKECIDAFVVDGCIRDQVAVYVINESQEGTVVRISGGRLRDLVSAIDFDARGSRG